MRYTLIVFALLSLAVPAWAEIDMVWPVVTPQPDAVNGAWAETITAQKSTISTTTDNNTLADAWLAADKISIGVTMGVGTLTTLSMESVDMTQALFTPEPDAVDGAWIESIIAQKITIPVSAGNNTLESSEIEAQSISIFTVTAHIGSYRNQDGYEMQEGYEIYNDKLVLVSVPDTGYAPVIIWSIY